MDRKLLIAALVVFGGMNLAEAQRTYPRVPGPTGRYYGPTQAAWQYQRRYGNPWPGQRPLAAPGHHHGHQHGGALVVPWGITLGGPYAPLQYYTPPIVIGGSGFYGGPSVFGPGGVYGGYGAWGGYGAVAPYGSWGGGFSGGVTGYGTGTQVLSGGSYTVVNPSAASGSAVPPSQPPVPAEIEPQAVSFDPDAPRDADAAVRHQNAGDTYFRSGNYSRAFAAYKDSLAADPTRPDPLFRMAFMFTAMRRYDAAIRHLKQGIDFAPAYARTGDRLDALYGPGRELQKQQMIQSVLEWAGLEPESPDRQLLAGAVLHFDNRQDAAVQYLETAAKLSRRPSRALALLAAREGPQPPSAPQPALKLTPESPAKPGVVAPAGGLPVQAPQSPPSGPVLPGLNQGQ